MFFRSLLLKIKRKDNFFANILIKDCSKLTHYDKTKDIILENNIISKKTNIVYINIQINLYFLLKAIYFN